MRPFVSAARCLSGGGGQFVWLALDSENQKNVAAMKAIPTNAFPTFYILDGQSGHVVRRLVGGMTLPQLHAFLDEARVAAADSPLGRADALYGAASYAEAATAYAGLLETMSATDPAYRRVIDAPMYSLSTTDPNAPLLPLSDRGLPRLRR